MTAALAIPADLPLSNARARTHLPALDGLRGIAVLLVMAHHFLMNAPTAGGRDAFFLGFLRSGWFGVDLFFVLSGFLITGILLDCKNRPHAIRTFYARRALRIFPLYFAVLLVAVIFSPILLPASTDGPLRGAFPALFLYASNFAQADGAWLEGRYLAFSHLWSLAIEEHFYLLWPWVIAAVPLRRLPAVCVIAFAGAAVLRAGFLGPLHGDPNAAYLLTPFRCDALLAGAFLAALHRTNGLDYLHRPAALVVSGGTMLLLAAIAKEGGLARPDSAPGSLLYCFLAIYFAALLILTLNASAARDLCLLPALRTLGKYSYGLYVFHWLLRPMFLPMTANRDHFLPGLALWIAATFLLTALSWRCLERPCLRLKDRLTCTRDQPESA